MNILIVDDEKSIRLTMCAFLENAGHTVHTAPNVSEARRLFSTVEVDVAVIDIIIGADSGVELSRWIRERSPNMQVVFITGEPEIKSARAAVHLGVFDYLTKPVGKDEIIEVVSRAAAEKQRRDDYDRMQSERRQHEEDLEKLVEERTDQIRKNEKHYRNLAELLPQGVFETDMDGRLTFANQKAFEMFGYSETDFEQGLNALQMISPRDRGRASDNLKRVLRGLAPHGEDYVAQTKKGREFPARIYSDAIASEGGISGLRGIVVNVTDEKKVIDELRRSRDEWEQTFNATSDMIIIVNKDHQIVRANRAATARCSKADRSLFGRRCSEVLHGTTQPPPDCPHAAVLRSGQESSSEIGLDCTDGDFLLTASPLRNEQGSVWGTVHVLREITERKRSERVLEESEQRFRSLFEEMPSGVAVCEAVEDGQDFILRDFNRAAEKIENKSRAEVIGKRVSEVFPGFVDMGLLSVLRHVWSTGETEFLAEAPYRGHAGKESWRENQVYRLPASGQVVAVYNDVTNRHKADEKLRELQRRETLGRLCAGVAHEYNNILMGIVGYAHHLRNRLECGTALHGFATEIEVLGNRATQVSRQLLNLTRTAGGKHTVCNFDTIVENAARTLGKLVDERIEVDVQLNCDANIEADEGQIADVLLNLLLNARDAMPEGGTVWVKTSILSAASSRVRRLSLAPGNCYVVVSVRDSGHGMSPETLENAFEPFFTTKDVGKGTGLGLSSAQGIVETHGGTIELESEEAQGTTVNVYLPVTTPQDRTRVGGTSLRCRLRNDDSLHTARPEDVEPKAKKKEAS